jgi:hypothetical protein
MKKGVMSKADMLVEAAIPTNICTQNKCLSDIDSLFFIARIAVKIMTPPSIK